MVHDSFGRLEVDLLEALSMASTAGTRLLWRSALFSGVPVVLFLGSHLLPILEYLFNIIPQPLGKHCVSPTPMCTALKIRDSFSSGVSLFFHKFLFSVS